MIEKVIDFVKETYKEVEERYDFAIFQEVIISHFTVCCLVHFYRPCSLDRYIMIFLLACVMGLTLARIFCIWREVYEVEYVVDDEENSEAEAEIKRLKILDFIWAIILTIFKSMIIAVVAWLEFSIVF